jgi:putative spermidine/putrescine transport system ATP-binding protein/putrescine transport system ATP-binding protein
VGVSCIVVTHDQEEAMSLADDLIVMNRGSIEQRGGPYELYNHPRSRFVAEFIGRSNFFDGIVTEGPAGERTFETKDGFGIRLADRATAFGKATICIRPERLTIGSVADTGLNSLSGHVADIVEFGTERQISVALASGRRVHVVEKDHRAVLPVNGAGCELSFRPDACIVIPADAEKQPAGKSHQLDETLVTSSRDKC